MNYTVGIAPTGGANIVAFQAPLQTLNLAGNALVAVASGFLDPNNNSNGPAFRFFVAPAAGGALLALPVAASVTEISANAYRVFPNPVRESFSLSYDESIAGAELEVMDAFGRLVYSNRLEGFAGSLQIDATAWSNGFYFGRISTANRATSFKIVVQK